MAVKLNTIYNIDSRKISEVLTADIRIQTTISSPPYFDMKDYGEDNQIGFGQSYEEYLQDIKTVFEQVFQYTKDDGTLWIVIDTFKRNNSVVMLPFDLASKLKESGWLLQDIIIWKKDTVVKTREDNEKLINPVTEEASRFFSYQLNGEIAVADGLSDEDRLRAEYTRDAFNLNEGSLVERRRVIINTIMVPYKDLGDDVILEALAAEGFTSVVEQLLKERKTGE